MCEHLGYCDASLTMFPLCDPLKKVIIFTKYLVNIYFISMLSVMLSDFLKCYMDFHIKTGTPLNFRALGMFHQAEVFTELLPGCCHGRFLSPETSKTTE